MAVPAVCTSNLRSSLVYYRDAWGFEVKQEVPGVLAVVQHGPVRLQLWQRPDLRKRNHPECASQNATNLSHSSASH